MRKNNLFNIIMTNLNMGIFFILRGSHTKNVNNQPNTKFF